MNMPSFVPRPEVVTQLPRYLYQAILKNNLIPTRPCNKVRSGVNKIDGIIREAIFM